MAYDFHLEELGPRAFEQLTAALAVAEFGAADIEVYGSGKDGGREVTFDGRIAWTPTGAPYWDGYTVIQAKQQQHVVAPADNLAWLKGQIRGEFDDWMSAKSQRGRFPEYLLFVTNTRLSAVERVGGIDQIRDYLEAELDRQHGTDDVTPRQRGMRAAKVWHRDTLNALISNHSSIRDAFPAILTIGDILARVQGLPGSIDPEVLAPVLSDHARDSLGHDRWIRFGEAGGRSRQTVEKVIVDLPARLSPRFRASSVLRRCLALGDRILRRSVPSQDGPRHLVITGAAGNGKSTLAKYLAQVYRSHFVRDEQNLGVAEEVVTGTDASLQRLDLPQPKNRRWPLLVSLPDMANAMGPSGGPSLMRWLAERVSERSSVEIAPLPLERWLKAWPCVLLLDGLDEVTAPAVRERMIDEITGLVDMADRWDADLLIVVTTRPTGYTERLLPEHFAQVDLDYLRHEEAVHYGRHVTSQRLHDDPDFRDQVLARFERAASADSSDRLLKTPLQVLILTFILERFGDLPSNRYGLFWAYYDTVYQREAEKPTSHRTFLNTHRDDITELHERVGLVLQVRAEGSDDVRPRLPTADLHALARERMKEVGHTDDLAATKLADRILQIATTRLVLLAADEDDTVSFDVRSLQELMAARALVNGDDQVIRRHLVATAPSPHWRNTWLFAAGRLFADGDHRRQLVLDIVDRFDSTSDDWPGWLYPISPELAADLLDDGLAAAKPAAERQLVDITLRCLRGPLPEDYDAIAQALRYASNDRTLNAVIRNAFRGAFSEGPTAFGIACALVLAASFDTIIPGQPTNQVLGRYAALWSASYPEESATVTVTELLGDAFLEIPDLPGASMVKASMQEFDVLKLNRTPQGDLWPNNSIAGFHFPQLRDVLRSEEATNTLQIALGSLAPTDWAARTELARAVMSWMSRDPVGHRIEVSYLS